MSETKAKSVKKDKKIKIKNKNKWKSNLNKKLKKEYNKYILIEIICVIIMILSFILFVVIDNLSNYLKIIFGGLFITSIIIIANISDLRINLKNKYLKRYSKKK